MGIAFRLAEEHDMKAIQKLWRDHTNWGELKEDTFRERVLDDPHQPVLLLAHEEDTQELVGQFLFVPSLLWIRGQYQRAYRPAAPIVAKSWRNFGINPLNHPVLRMYREGCARLKAQGAPLVYMVPSSTWTRLFKMFPEYKVGKFPLYKLPIHDREPRIGSDISFRELNIFDHRIDSLWNKFRVLHDICVARDSSTLPIKIRDTGATVVSVESKGEIIGLLCMKKKGSQWLINDIVFADTEDALASTSEVALYYGQEYSKQNSDQLEKVSVLATVQMIPTLSRIGFTRDSYSFPLVVQPLSEETSMFGDLSPEHWFVSAGD